MKEYKVGKYTVKESTDGDKLWYLNGERHREDGPAIEYANGIKYWYLNDKLHREDGPAKEYANGNKSWWINNTLHRENGPAIEYANGNKLWYLNGKKLTEFEFNAIDIFKNITSRKIINAINELEI